MSDAAAPAKSPAKKVKSTKTKKVSSHPTYFEMIVKAIVALKGRHGSSRQAIYKYIQKNFKVTDNPSANSHLKMALKQGVNRGTLKQAKGSGASGSFKLGEKKTTVAKKSKPATKKPKATGAKKVKKPKTAGVKKTKVKKPKAAGVKKSKPAAKKPVAKKPAAKKTVAKKTKKTAAKKPAAK